MNSIFADEPIVELSPDDSTLTEAGILVVDEDPAFQLGLKTFLKEYVGFEKVFTARNGREAIVLIEQEESIELLTLDYQMPEMDGLELLAHLQDNTPRPLAVTMITGFPSDELRREFADRTSSKLLTNHFLVKPIEFEKLEPVILEAYQDLKASQRLTETMTGEFSEEPSLIARSASHRELLARFDSLEKRLDDNTNALYDLIENRMLRYFWLDVLKLLLVAALLFMVWHSEWAWNLRNQQASDSEITKIDDLPQDPGEPQPMVVPLAEEPQLPDQKPEPSPAISNSSPEVLDANQTGASEEKKSAESLSIRPPEGEQ